MADWSKPTLASLYSDFLSEISARLVDSATLFSSAPTNAPTGAKRWNGGTNIFESYDSGTSAWSGLTLALAGGGTGATTASGARTNLGLGSMATQTSSSVSITGGSISGLSSFALSGALTAGGKISTTSAAADSIKTSGGLTAGGTVPVIGVDGRIPALSSTYFANLDGSNLTGLGSNTWSGLTGTPPAVSTFSNDSGYVGTSYFAAITSSLVPSATNSINLGSSSKYYAAVYIKDIYGALPSTTTNFCDPIVQDNTTDGRLYYKTNGANSVFSGAVVGLTVERGIVTSVSTTLGTTATYSVSGGVNRIDITVNDGIITALNIS